MTTHIKHSVRLFARRPVLAGALIATLALGIGANTAIFSLVRAVLLRPLPYEEPDRLVFTWLEWNRAPSSHDRHGILTGTHVIEWQRRSTTFESVAVIDSWANNRSSSLDLIHADGAERLRGAFVTPNFFELLGVRAAAGRTFDSADGASAQTTVAISDAFWRRRFGGDPFGRPRARVVRRLGGIARTGPFSVRSDSSRSPHVCRFGCAARRSRNARVLPPGSPGDED